MGQYTAVASVHLESLHASASARAAQLARIFLLLAAPASALLMGNFNFCSSWLEEQANLDPAYRDLWSALRADEPGYTEDTVVNLMRLRNCGRHKQVRFDPVLLRSRPTGWVPQAIRLLGDQPVRPDEPALFSSDHFGLLAELAWRGDVTT